MLNRIGVRSEVSLNKAMPKQSSPISPFLETKFDKVEFSKPVNSVIDFVQNGKTINVVTFTGLKNPLDEQKPALQMKVRGVMSHQKQTQGSFIKNLDENINELADSKWEDGQELNFSVVKKSRGDQIVLEVLGLGTIGRVPDEIAEKILPSIRRNPDAFKFELSNVIAGTTKGAGTIGLRVNLLYTGNDKTEEARVREQFNEVLNDPESQKTVLLYQPPTSPEEVLKLILDYEKKVKSPESATKMQESIENIVKEIKNPDNKNILLIGHSKPDGDTLGCVLGLKNAIKLMDSDRKVDSAIDDKIPGLFRHKLPGIDGEIKRPYNPEHFQELEKGLLKLKERPQNDITKSQINIIEQELKDEQNKDQFLDPQAKYDLVVLMDVPTPERFSGQFKKYIENAKKVIYIDHHPHRQAEWNQRAPEMGLNIEKVHSNKLAWIADTVPAATQLVSVIASKLLPALNNISKGGSALEVFNKPGQLDRFKAFVASVVTGASTDTGSFTRTANLLPEHIKMPVQDRPNFMPEGESKYLMNLTHGGIDKKWLREEISYDISDEKVDRLTGSPRDMMLKYAVEGKEIHPELSLGIVKVDYDKMYEIMDVARKAEVLQGDKPETTLLDIQNSFKYSEVLGTLRSDPTFLRKGGFSGSKDALSKAVQQDYKGNYDNDRIALLICQDKKEGNLDEKMNIATQNSLRLSIRSQEGSIHAELLANLFSGGGHGSASGGRVVLPGVTLDSKLAVKINDKIVKDSSVILKELKNNHQIMNDESLTDDEKQAKCKKLEIVMDSEGKTCSELVTDVVKEIRATANLEKQDNSKVIPFAGNKIISINKFLPNIFAKENQI